MDSNRQENGKPKGTAEATLASDTPVTESGSSSSSSGGDGGVVGEEGESIVEIQVRCSNGKKFTVQVNLLHTILQFKEQLVPLTNDTPVERQRLIYKGKILKDSQLLGTDVGLQANHTIHFVKGSAPPSMSSSSSAAPGSNTGSVSSTSSSSTTSGASASTSTTINSNNPWSISSSNHSVGLPGLANPFGMGNSLGGGGGGLGLGLPDMASMQQQMMQNPDMMRQMMDSPMFQSVLNQPDILRNMIQNNPAMRQVLDANPQLNHVLNDPELMRQTMEAVRNPAAMREMMRNQDTALRNIESHPEGFNALRRMYQDVQEPLMDAASQGMGSTGAQAQAHAGGSMGRGFSSAFPMPGSTPRTLEQSSNSPTTSTVSSSSSSSSSSSIPNPWASLNESNTTGTGTGTGNRGMGLNMGLGMGGRGGENQSGLGNPLQMLAAMQQNPMFASTLQSMMSNPAMIEQMGQMNPQFRSLLQTQPELRTMLQSPEFLQTVMNPQNLQAMIQMQQMMQQLPSSQPGLTPGRSDARVVPPPSTATAASPALDFGQLFSMMNMGAGAANAPRPPALQPEQLYASQLQQMTEMGFLNREQNIRALEQTFGNVNAAIERIFNGQA